MKVVVVVVVLMVVVVVVVMVELMLPVVVRCFSGSTRCDRQSHASM